MRLQTWREARKLTRNAFARKAGVDPFTVRRVEEGKGCNTTSMARITVATGGDVMPHDMVPNVALARSLRLAPGYAEWLERRRRTRGD